MEFKEFEPRFKSAKTRFKLSAGLNLETFDTILSRTIFKPWLKFKPPLKFFKFGHWLRNDNVAHLLGRLLHKFPLKIYKVKTFVLWIKDQEIIC